MKSGSGAKIEDLPAETGSAKTLPCSYNNREFIMHHKMLALVAGAAMSALMLAPDTALARFGGGFRGGGFVGGFHGAAIGGWRGGAVGWRGGVAGWRGGVVGW